MAYSPRANTKFRKSLECRNVNRRKLFQSFVKDIFQKPGASLVHKAGNLSRSERSNFLIL